MKRQSKTLSLSSALAVACSVACGTQAQFYDHDFQEPVGDPAIFNVVGDAVKDGPDHDSQGDAFLESVEFPGGKKFTQYYRPIAVTYFDAGDDTGRLLSVHGGSRITEGISGKWFLGDSVDDGGSSIATDADVEVFSERLRHALASNNLNWYMDCGGNPVFEFILEFDLVLKDNDPEPDDFGELLYFERGTAGGNSWLTLQAVDEHGNPLGPELAISPEATYDTSPPTQISHSSQYIGATSVDISRLGVSETRYLLVRSTRTTDSGHYNVSRGGIDYQPDFKFMAVITDPEQIALRTATYD